MSLLPGTRSGKHTLTLAHSADADDVYMWWPLTGKLDPSGYIGQNKPSEDVKLLEEPRLVDDVFAFRGVPEDIAVLNRLAFTKPTYDISAISFGAYPAVSGAYRLCAFGSSFGDGYGPKLVTKAGVKVGLGQLAQQDWTIAVPGLKTTACITLQVLLAQSGGGAVLNGGPKLVEMRFDTIIEAVASGQVDAGLVIHEGQLMFQDSGLALLVDLGYWWREATGLVMPLGGNAIRRDLDARFGVGSIDRVTRLLQMSLAHVMLHRREALDYARLWSPLKGDAELTRYIDMYVNKWTYNAHPRGIDAVDVLLGKAAALGLVPGVTPVDFVSTFPKVREAWEKKRAGDGTVIDSEMRGE